MDFTDATAWTFAHHACGRLPHFHITIPDTHRIEEPSRPSGGFASRAVPGHADGCMIAGIVNPLMDPGDLDFDRFGFDELYYALARSMGIDCPGESLLFQREWTEHGKNCTVLVLQFAKKGTRDVVFQLQPICKHLGEHVRLEVRDGADPSRRAATAASAIATSLELEDTSRSELVRELLRAKGERIDVSTYSDVCSTLFALLNRSRDLHHAANQREYALTAEHPTTEGLMDVVVSGLEECGERMMPYIEAAIEGLETQRRLDADPSDVIAMSEPLLRLLGAVLVKFEPEGPEEEAYMRTHGAIEVPDRFWEISDRFDAAVAGLA